MSLDDKRQRRRGLGSDVNVGEEKEKEGEEDSNSERLGMATLQETTIAAKGEHGKTREEELWWKTSGIRRISELKPTKKHVRG